MSGTHGLAKRMRISLI